MMQDFLKTWVNTHIMTWTHIILRYGELFLKGKNKPHFVRALLRNIKAITGTSAKDVRSRMVIPYFNEHASLKRVFGLVSYSPSIRVEKDLGSIMKTAASLVQIGTFRIATKRSDKTFPIKSPDMNVKVGTYVGENTDATFDFDNPDVTISVEINQEGVYLFTDKVICFGGLPTGVEGKVELLVEDESSVLAGLLCMKRGCTVIPVMKEVVDISILQEYSPTKLRVKDTVTSDLVISGQTFDDYKEYGGDATIFRPLIAYDEERIKKELELYS
jgi:adenylyl- and sulfurtransferase ThiI